MIPTIPIYTPYNYYPNTPCYLADTISCVVTQELNGIYEVELIYPITGEFADRVRTLGGYLDVLVAPMNESRYYASVPRQRFRINKIVRNSNGTITFHGQHISYALNQYLALPGNRNLSGWTSHINAQLSEHGGGFSVVNDSTVSASLLSESVRSVSSLIFGEDTSITSLLGVDVERDNEKITIKNQLGEDRGLRIRYGRNIQSFESEWGWPDDQYIGAVAWWSDGTTTVRSSSPPTSRMGGIMLIDATNDFRTAPSAAALRNLADSYVAQHPQEFNAGSRHSIDIVYTPLPGEEVMLGDTVHVGLGMESYGYAEYEDMRVTKVVYDVLAGHYSSVSLGDKRIAITDTIAKLVSNSGSSSNSESIEKAIGNRLSDYTFIAFDNINGNSSHTYNLANNTRAVIFLTAAANQAGDIVFATATSGGVARATNIVAGGDYTITAGTNTMTIRSATSSVTTVAALVFSGNVT